jgi:ABC-type Fe3+/spermidine/putrescine transport system ATPase subunit
VALKKPKGGDIQLGDSRFVSDARRICIHRRDIGMVFQTCALAAHGGLEVVAYPLTRGRIKGTEAKKLAEALG